MKNIAMTVLLLSTLCCQVSAAANEVDEIVNYVEYSAELSSAGQPTTEQLRAANDAGFERVVFLAFSDHEGSLANEDRLVKELGMEFVHIPVDWEAPTVSDFELFSGAMQGSPGKKTLVHCQVNFRASTFSFLYRVLHAGVPMAAAKQDMESVWVPNQTWQDLIFSVLEANGVSPDCDGCLWQSD